MGFICTSMLYISSAGSASLMVDLFTLSNCTDYVLGVIQVLHNVFFLEILPPPPTPSMSKTPEPNTPSQQKLCNQRKYFSHDVDEQ